MKNIVTLWCQGIKGTEIIQLTPQPQWPYCEIPEDMEVTVIGTKGRETIVLMRGNQVSTAGQRRRKPGSMPPANHNLGSGLGTSPVYSLLKTRLQSITDRIHVLRLFATDN